MKSRLLEPPPLSAPPMAPTAPPPPPAAGTRLPWPAPPGGAPNAGEQPLSDTMERMLRPQGLFHNPQPKPFDWQQPWAAPALAGTAGGATPPLGLDSTMPHPPPAPPAAPARGGPQWPSGNGGQYPPGSPYQTTALLQPGAPTPAGTGYPPGQYEPGQYPTAQYGPGQYDPGQYDPGQYGPGGQPPAEQFGPGAFPSGQYGPGPQYGPDGLPLAGAQPPRKLGGLIRPRGPLIATIAAVALIIIVIAVIASTRGNSNPGPAAAGNPSAKAGTTATASPSAGTASLTQRQAAVRLSALLAQSGTDRAQVNTAYFDVQACGKQLADDAGTFSRAAASRQTLLTRLAQLPGRSALSAAMVADLTAAWQASATVDTDLGKWAAAAAGHCRKGNPRDSSLMASAPFDSQATINKQAFARLWNRLAHRDGLSAVTVDQL